MPTIAPYTGGKVSYKHTAGHGYNVTIQRVNSPTCIQECMQLEIIK